MLWVLLLVYILAGLYCAVVYCRVKRCSNLWYIVYTGSWIQGSNLKSRGWKFQFPWKLGNTIFFSFSPTFHPSLLFEEWCVNHRFICPLIVICIYLSTGLPLNRIKGTRLGEQNGLSTDKVNLHLRQSMCSFCSPLHDNGPKWAGWLSDKLFYLPPGFSVSLSFSLALLPTSAKLFLFLSSCTFPCSSFISTSLMMYMPKCWSRRDIHGDH